MDITVLTPTIPPRTGPDGPFGRAVTSAQTQTLRPTGGILVELDVDRTGAAATRNRLLERVTTEWVAFLDDDDELYPDHLRRLARCATLTGADLVYPLYDCTGPDPIDQTGDGWPGGRSFDPQLLRRGNYIPVTVLARTQAVRDAGGFQPHPDRNGNPCEDWGLWLAMLDRGNRLAHLPAVTWRWHNAHQSTRGRGDRW